MLVHRNALPIIIIFANCLNDVEARALFIDIVIVHGSNVQTILYQVLVLSPTREIAVQTRDVIRAIGRHTALQCNTFIGGMALLQDADVIKSTHIVIGTPGMTCCYNIDVILA